MDGKWSGHQLQSNDGQIHQLGELVEDSGGMAEIYSESIQPICAKSLAMKLLQKTTSKMKFEFFPNWGSKKADVVEWSHRGTDWITRL